MSWSNRFLAVTFLAATMLLSGGARAMTIQQFDKMADADQADYVLKLIHGAEKVLTDEGRSDLAGQVEQLFTTRIAGDADVTGIVEFIRNLAMARVADAKNAAARPNDPRIEVEDAMFLTLQKNHVDLPGSFFAVNKDFSPRHPQDKKN